MVATELGNTSKLESLKSRIRRYLNFERHVSTNDFVEGLTPSPVKRMVRKLFDFCKHLKTFSFYQELSEYDTCQTFLEMFWI